MRNVRKTAAQSRHTAGLSAYSQSPMTAPLYPFTPVMSQAALTACQPGLACNQSMSDETIVSLHKPAALPQPPCVVFSTAPTAEPGVQQVVAMLDKVLSLCNNSLATSHQATTGLLTVSLPTVTLVAPITSSALSPSHAEFVVPPTTQHTHSAG